MLSANKKKLAKVKPSFYLNIDKYLDIIGHLNIIGRVSEIFKLSKKDGILKRWDRRSKTILSSSLFLSTRCGQAAYEKVRVGLSTSLLL